MWGGVGEGGSGGVGGGGYWQLSQMQYKITASAFHSVNQCLQMLWVNGLSDEFSLPFIFVLFLFLVTIISATRIYVAYLLSSVIRNDLQRSEVRLRDTQLGFALPANHYSLQRPC